MTQYVFAFLFVAFFIAIAYTGELKGFLLSQWDRVKSFTLAEWALGVVLLLGTGIATHYAVEWLTPVLPALARSEATHAARAHAEHASRLPLVAGLVVALGCMLLVNGIANVVREWYGDEWGWLGIVRNLVACLLLNWLVDTSLSFLLWYTVQNVAASLVFGGAWLVQRHLVNTEPEPRQRAAEIAGNSVAAQFLLMFCLILVADLILIVLL